VTLVRVARKASRLPAVVRDGWNYPALRVRANNRQTPVEALRALGFDGRRLRGLEQGFDRVAAELYATLAEAARDAGAIEAERRLLAPSSASRDAKKLLYLATRIVAPSLVVETGAFNGAASSFLLAALDENGHGKLLSFDLLAARDALGIPVAGGRRPGWLVPAELRQRFELVLGDTRETLERHLCAEQCVDMFMHDSMHTLRHMLFEYRVAWRHLSLGGLLLSDDVFWNPAFWVFTKRHRVPFHHTGTMGSTRKRL
jgi:predicted O-methyltransferase YrrM